MKPERIQLSRKKGFRLPPNTISVARPSKWGNPFRIGGYFMIGGPVVVGGLRMSWCEATPQAAGPGYTFIENAAMAVEFFKRLMERGYHKDLSELRGKNIACWCQLPIPGEPDICHGAVYLELANKPPWE
jgi:hypothetical protein